MPAELGSLLIRVGASVADFTSDMRRVEQQATKSAKSAQASMAGIGRALAAGVVTGATAAATGVQIAINKMDALNDSAKSLGLSVTTLTELGFAAEQSGSSVSTLAQGFRKLAVFQGEVAGGNKDAVELARRLGVSMVEVNGDLRDQGEVFADLAERFKGYKDGAGETALAAKLLGRAAGPELLQLLNQGKGGVVALRDEARALSASLGTEAAASAAQFNDNLDKLKTLTSGLFQQLAVQLLPMLLAFSELLVQSGKDANAAAGGFSFITKTFRVLAVGAAIVKNTLEAVVGILAATATTISNFVEATTVSLGVWGNAIKANIEGGPLAGFRALVEGTRASGERQQELLTGVVAGWSAAKTGITDAVSDVTDAFEAANATAEDFQHTVSDAGTTAATAAPPLVKVEGAVADVGNAAERAADQLAELQEGLADARTAGLSAVEHIEDLAAELQGPASVALRSYTQELAKYRTLLDDGAISAAELARAEAVLAQNRDVQLRDINARLAEDGRRTQQELARQAEEASREFTDAWDNAINSVGESFGDFVAGGFTRFKSFLSSMKNALRSWISDVVGALASSALRNAFGSFAGGASGGASGGAGGGLLGSIGSLFGGGGGVGAGLPALGAITGILAGIQNPAGSLLGSAGRIGAFGVGGAVAGTIGFGALAGGAAGAAVGAAGAGAATGALGAAAAIPVAGIVIAAIALLDIISGGKVFGTKFQTRGVTQNLTLSDEGGSASTVLRQTRQAALFGGKRTRFRDTASSPEAIQAANDLFLREREIIENASRLLDAAAPSILESSIRTVTELTKKGKVKSTKIFVDILGRTWEEATQELAIARLDAEQLIHAIDASLQPIVDAAAGATSAAVAAGMIAGIDEANTSVDGVGGERNAELPGRRGGDPLAPVSAAVGEASQIAERWRASADLLLDGATFLLAAQVAINNDVGLLGELGSLTDTTELVEELQRFGESLTDTFTRLQQITGVMREAFGRLGSDVDVFTADFVRFSDEFQDAAGGLQQAAALWDTYFATFTTADQNIERLLASLRKASDEALGVIGVDSAVSLAEFRELFEKELPTLSAEALATWLQAASALAALNQAEAQVAAAREQEAAVLAQQAEAAAQLTQFLADLSEVSEFGQDVRDIRDAIDDMTAQANELAIAAGRASASTEELGNITVWASRQYALAVDRLRQRVSELVQQLFGSELDQLTSQIDAAESSAAAAQSAAEAAAAANAQRYEQELAFILQIQDFVDSLRLSPLSPLSPQDRFLEAQSQFAADLAAARAGDLDALGRVQGDAQAFLAEARAFLGNNDQFGALFNEVLAALEGLGVSGATGGGATTTTILLPSPELEALYARREEILAEQEAQSRFLIAQQLAEQLGELAAAQSTTVQALAESLGFTLRDLVANLGINLDEVTAATVQQLAAVAQTLGTEFGGLAATLGVTLGSISDTTSLLNDALELEIGALPEDIRGELEPLLRAVEEATTEADANAALAQLTDAVDVLAPELRNELAPFLGLPTTLIDPIEGVTNSIVDFGGQQVDALNRANDWLSDIANNTAAQAAGVVPPGTASAAPSSVGEGGGSATRAVIDRLDSIIRAVTEGAQRQSDAVSQASRFSNRARG